MTSLSLEFLTGVQVGIEHIDCRGEGYGVQWLIAINLLVIRIVITKWENEEE